MTLNFSIEVASKGKMKDGSKNNFYGIQATDESRPEMLGWNIPARRYRSEKI